MRHTILSTTALFVSSIAVSVSAQAQCPASQCASSKANAMTSTCSTEQNTDKNIVEVAASAGQFTKLIAAAKAAGLAGTLSSKGPFTVFAPTDAAFGALPDGTLEALLADKQKLAAILTYHVLPQRVMSKDIKGSIWAASVQGQSLRVVASESGVSVDGARVLKADIAASNGVIHVIDKVILPRENIVSVASKAGSFKTLLAAAKAAGLAGTLAGKGPFTVFAPSDKAFAQIPEKTLKGLLADKKALSAILLNHVVPGRLAASDVLGKTWLDTAAGPAVWIRKKEGAAMVDDARIVGTDVFASNGVVHVIDKVILPRKNIVETALVAGSLKTLLKAAQAAGLVEALVGKGPLTVFAPTDEAFGKLPKGKIAALLADKEALKSILLYHVVPSRVLAGDIPMARAGANASIMAKTLQGQKLRVLRNGEGVTIDGANVVSANVVASNGIIHVIDRVLIPGSGERNDD